MSAQCRHHYAAVRANFDQLLLLWGTFTPILFSLWLFVIKLRARIGRTDEQTDRHTYKQDP